MEIVTIDLPLEAQACHIKSRPQSIAPVPVDHALSTPTPRVGVRRRKKDQSTVLSTTLPPSTGRLKVAKFGKIASSATAGSSNESVPGKNRFPAIPCACAE